MNLIYFIIAVFWAFSEDSQIHTLRRENPKSDLYFYILEDKFDNIL
jgi:hypothetical protein